MTEFPHTFASASGFPTFASLPDPAMAGQFAEVYQQWTDAMNKEPAKLAEFQRRYMEEHVELLRHLMDGKRHAMPEDKRFASEAWLESPAFHYLAHSYLITSRLFMEALNDLPLTPDKKRRMRFFAKQYFDAIAPSNYLLTNPEAMQKALESKGESLKAGLENLTSDIEKGQISMTDESAFKVGENIAISEGAVVYENELFQLIQYKPLTEDVHLRPLLMVPPCINKFYILDMRPENSLVRFAVEQGHTVFMVSWRNVKEDLGHLTWDHYVAGGVIQAIDAVRVITQVHKINVLGFCIGGTLVSCALSVLHDMGEDVVESVTLLTSFLDFSDTGEVSAYVDRGFVERREREVGKGGIVPGSELAFAFASLRANDLVWNYVVNNYLKGQAPPAFDLLYWNADSTNLPGPMYSYYIRNAYLENNFVKPGKLSMCGHPLDFRHITQPAFVFAAREDHIVPWRTAYESARQLRGEVSFTLGASGHIAGVVNPASKNRRSYWQGPFDRAEPRPDNWLAGAAEVPGSWWNPWAQWLKAHGGRKVPARHDLGGHGLAPIEPAPGRYVTEKA
ncbi:MAG: class I poly(R)-hydroxyalkanoic acid synthase [Burkholderiales bacterium]|nr:class I poly(R)-hydroxyalkanoic acid synthase [Burkholderiales bacterium]